MINLRCTRDIYGIIKIGFADRVIHRRFEAHGYEEERSSDSGKEVLAFHEEGLDVPASMSVAILAFRVDDLAVGTDGDGLDVSRCVHGRTWRRRRSWEGHAPRHR